MDNVPILNRGHPYQSVANRTIEDDELQFFQASTQIKKRTHMSDERFKSIYDNTMRFFTVQERYMFRKLQTGEEKRENFYNECARYLKDHFAEMRDDRNDFSAMMDRIHLSMFQYDVIQPLIDHPDTTDIKICSPDDIRVRVKGKALKSDVFFSDDRDLYRFIDALALRNGVDILGSPYITFTDNHDAGYILRFTISSPVVNAVDYPYLHIRKISKTKLSFDDLIEAKMLTENIKGYLIDKAKLSRGIVFAGPPGSGKTTALNAFIEHIPKTRETLVIQENDELFTSQSGFMFKHTSSGFGGTPVVTLEDLGKMALVEGCNEFIIGEVKGGEMRSVMTLLNSGGYAALTVHSTNAYETLDKLADLVKYGSSYTFEEARRMLRTFDTVVYMEGYKVREILEVDGYDDITHQYHYTPIYKYQS